MACVNPDGTLTTVARGVLRAIADGSALGDIAADVGLPLYRVRASLRELTEAGFVLREGEALTVTRTGAEALET